MRITQRQITIVMQIINAMGLAFLSIALWISDNTAADRLSVMASFFISIFLFMLYLRGWPYTIPVILITVIAIISFTTPLPIFAIKTSIQLLLPAAIAMLLGNTRWVIVAQLYHFLSLFCALALPTCPVFLHTIVSLSLLQ